MLTNFLLIGEILKPQGVAGEVKVKPYTDDPDRFLRLKEVFFQEGEAYHPRGVHCSRVNDGFAYLSVEGFDTREAVEKLRGEKLFVDRAHAVPLSEDEVFICDLIGCEAVDVYVFDTPKGRMLMPALKAAVPTVDVKARKVVLDESKLPEVAFFED